VNLAQTIDPANVNGTRPSWHAALSGLPESPWIGTDDLVRIRSHNPAPRPVSFAQPHEDDAA
jgi:hypothetical protein